MKQQKKILRRTTKRARCNMKNIYKPGLYCSLDKIGKNKQKFNKR